MVPGPYLTFNTPGWAWLAHTSLYLPLCGPPYSPAARFSKTVRLARAGGLARRIWGQLPGMGESCEMQGYPLQNRIPGIPLPGTICETSKSWGIAKYGIPILHLILLAGHGWHIPVAIFLYAGPLITQPLDFVRVSVYSIRVSS